MMCSDRIHTFGKEELVNDQSLLDPVMDDDGLTAAVDIIQGLLLVVVLGLLLLRAVFGPEWLLFASPPATAAKQSHVIATGRGSVLNLDFGVE